jgi:predicted CXXCH cytochrome family protein
MLPGPQTGICLSCHGNQAGQDRLVRESLLTAGSQPGRIDQQLAHPFVHPLNHQAFSRHEPGAVVCTSCHSPHRTSTGRDLRLEDGPGTRISTRDPSRFEYELCEGCHGHQGVSTRSLLDISRLFDPNSRSYHPVKAPAMENSPSVDPGFTGRQISCTHCHGTGRGDGTGGIHGSAVQHLLAAEYVTLDGESESVDSYRLCYGCHDRDQVLGSVLFPEHDLHIVTERTSCATCHNAHGSVENRALIRFGEETTLSGVSPSLSTGRLSFESEIPGEGACYLTCHGIDHNPATYSGGSGTPEPIGSILEERGRLNIRRR